MCKSFFKNVKEYLSYIMKVGFGDLFIEFFTLVMILVLSCFIYVPIGMLEDVIINAMRLTGSAISDNVYAIADLIFKMISMVLSIYAFMYMFNKRYDDVKSMKENLGKKDKAKNGKPKKEDLPEIDLPKEK